MYKSNIASGEDIWRLAARVKRSDPKAFKTLFELYHQNIFNFIYLKLREVEAAEDCRSGNVRKTAGKPHASRTGSIPADFFIHDCHFYLPVVLK